MSNSDLLWARIAIETAETTFTQLYFKSDCMIMMEDKPLSEYTESEIHCRNEILVKS